MARARNIKPGFFKNEDLAELPFSTRLLFIGLWTLADREGRMEDRPKRVKMELFPGDDVNVEKGLNELHASGFITRYEVDGGRFIEVTAFLKHQHPHFKEPPSTIPKPEALPPLQQPQSPGLDGDGKKPKPAASPRQTQGQHQSGPADSGFLIPDSLIPDKNNTGPSPTDSAGPGTAVSSPSEENGKPQPTKAGQWATELRHRGVTVTSAHPTLLAWITDGFTLPWILEAVDLARQAKPAPESIPANYLDRIVRKPPKKAEPAWWSSEKLILRKGVELNLNPRPGEEMDQFKSRIQDAMARAKEAV